MPSTSFLVDAKVVSELARRELSTSVLACHAYCQFLLATFYGRASRKA